MRAELEMAPMKSETISKAHHLHVTDEGAINQFSTRNSCAIIGVASNGQRQSSVLLPTPRKGALWEGAGFMFWGKKKKKKVRFGLEYFIASKAASLISGGGKGTQEPS